MFSSVRSACGTAPDGSSPGPAASCATKVRSPTVAPTAKAGSSETSHRAPGAGGGAGAPCEARADSNAPVQTAPAAPPRNVRRESREQSNARPELHMSASFTSLGHVFYAKLDNERDHEKMDAAGWHNRASGRTGARAAMVRRYRGMIKRRWRVSAYLLAPVSARRRAPRLLPMCAAARDWLRGAVALATCCASPRSIRPT
jgi:hypothetical protein